MSDSRNATPRHQGLLDDLARQIAEPEYDCPGDAPELVGYLCGSCRESSAEVSGIEHLESCVISRVKEALETRSATESTEAALRERLRATDITYGAVEEMHSATAVREEVAPPEPRCARCGSFCAECHPAERGKVSDG